jgi:hypothetical protein
MHEIPHAVVRKITRRENIAKAVGGTVGPLRGAAVSGNADQVRGIV